MVSLIEPEPRVASSSLRLRETVAVSSPFTAKPADVVQGDLGACPVAAMMAALARTRPAKLTAMLGPPITADVSSKRTGDKSIRFRTKFYYDVKFPGRGKPTRISGVLYHKGRDVVYAQLPGGAGWPSLIEKAYAVWRGRNSYSNLDRQSSLSKPPDGGRVMCDLVGQYDMAAITSKHWYEKTSCTKGTADSDRALEPTADIRKMARRSHRRPTIAASRPTGTGHDIKSNHAYAVVGYRKDRILLRNPHGGSGADVRISVAAFLAEFQAVWQGY